VSFLTPFKEAALLLEAVTYATLLLVQPVRFNKLNHLNVLVSNFHELVELKILACIILNEKFPMRNLLRIGMLLWPNVRQLRLLSTQEQGETMHNVQM
jgi:hypothetical protein